MEIALSSPYILTGLILVSLEVLVAILTFAYITVAILHDIYNKKSMDHVYKIQGALVFSSFIFTIVSSANFFCDFVWPVTCKGEFSNDVLLIFTVYSISSGAWLTALMCVTFFSKIVDLKSNCFSWVKNLINSIYVIVGVEVSCVASGFLTLLIAYHPQETLTNSSFLLPTNGTYRTSTEKVIVAEILLVLVFIPILTVATLSTVIGRFLKLQGHKMERNMGQAGEVSQKLYNNLVSRMLQIIILYSVFYLVTFLFYFSVFSHQSLWYWVIMIVMLSFTPTQFIIVIIHNTNVRRAWKEMSDNMIVFCCKQ